MACKENEIIILKSTATKLNDDTMMVLNLMYHTADKEAKKNGAKSFYRYEGTVMKIEDFKQMITDMKSDEHAMEDWTWPTKDSWWKPDYFIAYAGNKTNLIGAKWYQNRLNKMVSWDAFMELAKEGIKHTARGIRKSDSAKYELNDYITDDGTKFNIDTPENMAKLVGKCFGHQLILKRELAKA